MKRLQIVSLVFGLLFFLTLAGLAMWIYMSRQAGQRSPNHVPGAYNSLVGFEFSRQFGRRESDPGSFYRGFVHAQNMDAYWPEKSKTPPWWRALGPKNWAGRTLALAIDSENPNRIFSGAASGGLWVSHTGGRGDQAWEYVDTGYPILGVASIALDPSNSQTMLIGTGEVYSYETGMPSIGERILRGSFGIGILKSTNGGITWETSLDWRYQNQTGVQAIEFDPMNPERVWAATTEGIYRSEDRGDSWIQVLAVVMATDIVIHPAQPDSVLVACGGMHSPDNGLYRTQDGGENWARMTSGLPGSIGGKAMLGGSSSHPNVVYATVGRHPYEGEVSDALVRSNNFGSTWTTVSQESFARFQGFYSHFVGVHPQDPDRIIVGGVEMWDSRNGGRTLEMTQIEVIDNEIVDTMVLLDAPWVDTFGDNHTMAFHPENPDIFYVGCDQGIFRTENSGRTYERCVGGYQTTQFYDGMAQDQTNKNRLWGSIQDWAGIAFAGTSSWVLDDTFFEGGKILIDPHDPDLRYTSYYYVDWVHRIDHGTLTDITPPPSGTGSFGAPFALAPSNPSVLYAGRDVVFRSNNRGDTWQVTNSGYPIGPARYNPTLSMAVAHTDENRVYVSTAPYITVTPSYSRTHVYRTSNGGQTWNEITGSLPNRFVTDMKVDPIDRDRLFLTLGGFGSSHVYLSNDAGATWEDLDRGLLPDVPTWAIILDPHLPNGLYIGNDLGVFATFDLGQSWTPVNRGLPPAVMVLDLVIFEEERLLRAGTHGNGVFELSLPAYFDAPTGSSLPHHYGIPGVNSADLSQMVGCVVNHDPNITAQLEVFAFGADGVQIEGSTVLTELAPGHRFMGTLEQLFPDLEFPKDTQIGWIQIGADVNVTAFYEKRSVQSQSAASCSQPWDRVFVPHVAKDTVQFETQISVVNASSDPGPTIFQTYPQLEQIQIEENASGFSQATFLARDALGESIGQTDWAELNGETQLLMGSEVFRTLPERNKAARLELNRESSPNLRFLHVARDTSLFWTGVVYLNTSTDPVSITERYYDDSGQTIEEQSQVLEGLEKRTLLFDANTVSSGQVPSNVSWMEILSDGQITGYELFGSPNGLADHTFAGLPASSGSGTALCFPHFQAGPALWIGYVLVNTAEDVVQTQIEILDPLGQTMVSHQFDLDPKAKITMLGSALVPQEQWEQAAWVRATCASDALEGFLLWGDHNGPHRQTLSGILASVIAP